MDKKALMDYALYARKELETQIALSLNKLGIYKDRNAKCNIVGERTVIEGVEQTFPKNVYELRSRIISEHISADGFDAVVEEFAYTWFNRIIALRFMEVHDYFPHGFRVLTARGGGYEPEILRNLSYVAADLELDMSKVDSYKSAGEDDELYRYVLFSQCNALSEILPMLFDRQQEYMELLLPRNLLSQNSVIRRIVDIPEQDFLNDIEVIGWLYQFYNSVKKDEVYASKQAVTKETLPAVTQLFTPDWIVRYMAQNSVGRIWLDSYPNSSLKSAMNYYVEDAPQCPQAAEKLEHIRYQNVNPEEIRIIEPCCGSGHILVYVFELLYEMYLEKGYNRRDIPKHIFNNNLFGLDIDKRASQLSQFSLMMKARSVDPRFFNSDRIVIPKVFEILDSKQISNTNYKEQLNSFGFSRYSLETLEYLISVFSDAKVIGSLLKIEKKDYELVKNEVHKKATDYLADTTQMHFQLRILPQLEKICDIAAVLSSKYDVMITNPPYLSYDKMSPEAKIYVTKHFYSGRYDFYSSFILKKNDFLKANGYSAFITMHNYMFAPSFDDFRLELLKKDIVSLLHLGTRAFEEISGEIVQTASVVFRNSKIAGLASMTINVSGETDSHKKKDAFFDSKNVATFEFDSCNTLPNGIFAYSLESNLINLYKNEKKISNYAIPKAGIVTGDDEYFIRFWYEVKYSDISFGPKIPYGKYHLFTKGGAFEKWYGANIDYVIKLADLYDSSKTNKSVRRGDPDCYFKKGIGWSQVAGGTNKNFSIFENCLCKTTTPAIYPIDENKTNYLLAVLNSSAVPYILKRTNPTLSILTSDIANLPLIYREEAIELINKNVEFCIEARNRLLKTDEANFSFNANNCFFFEEKTIERSYFKFADIATNLYHDLSEKEYELDNKIIQLYGLQSNITPTHPKYDVLNSAEYVIHLLSYLVGLIMGRYSLETGNILYAGGDFAFQDCPEFVDSDGILPIYQFLGIENGLTQSLTNLIARLFGQETLNENLNYLANALEPGTTKTSFEIINRYLHTNFYSDHLKIYKKHPIYWMFSSGKHGAFECLLYMHRYNKNTLAMINSKYFLPRTAMYKAERERLQGRIDSGMLDTRELREVRKQLDEVLACEQELLEYGQVLDHMANQYIDISLDDGVKVNYAKFQGIELEVDGRTIKKDLFVPIK